MRYESKNIKEVSALLYDGDNSEDFRRITPFQHSETSIDIGTRSYQMLVIAVDGSILVVPRDHYLVVNENGKHSVMDSDSFDKKYTPVE